ncbi:unknown [Roseburia sp. CAG:309]|nr:unknown [Roseburia sp. CAG:309]
MQNRAHGTIFFRRSSVGIPIPCRSYIRYTIFISRRTQPPVKSIMLLRREHSLCCLSCRAGSMKWRFVRFLKSILRIRSFVNRQQIYFVLCIGSGICLILFIVLIYNGCLLNCLLLFFCKCLLDKLLIEPFAQRTFFPCYGTAFLIKWTAFNRLICHQKSVVSLYRQHSPANRQLLVLLIGLVIFICVLLPVISKCNGVPCQYIRLYNWIM